VAHQSGEWELQSRRCFATICARWPNAPGGALKFLCRRRAVSLAPHFFGALGHFRVQWIGVYLLLLGCITTTLYDSNAATGFQSYSSTIRYSTSSQTLFAFGDEKRAHNGLNAAEAND